MSRQSSSELSMARLLFCVSVFIFCYLLISLFYFSCDGVYRNKTHIYVKHDRKMVLCAQRSHIDGAASEQVFIVIMIGFQHFLALSLVL